MKFDFIKYEKKGHLVYITINRPDVMNALHPPANQEMDKAFDNFSEDTDAWVAILSGAGGRAFCAGNDLKYQAEHGIDAIKKGMEKVKGGFGGITARFDCFKPIIAAITGMSLGGGTEIALACDIIIAADNTSFGLPEPRVGLIAGAGGIQRLPLRIPYHIAMGYILTGKHIPAIEAKKLGLINEVVPPDEVINTAEKWAADILECAPLAVRASKEGALLGQEHPLKELIGKPFPGFATVFQSEDIVEGAKAFTEKRKPHWEGK